MKDRTTHQGKGGIKGDSGRAERLAEELRANLVRRKIRARKAKAASSRDETPAKDGGEP